MSQGKPASGGTATATIEPPKPMDASPRIDVPKPLTAQQVKFFVNEGYLVVPDLITKAERDPR